MNLPSGDYYRLQKTAAGADFITQLLCVSADHNPSLGLSYPGGVVQKLESTFTPGVNVFTTLSSMLLQV